MPDKYWVYRPLIDLIGETEGTAPPKGRGYNETLNYGAYTGGPVELVKMTLQQVDELQTRMLAHPKNKLRSSAAGWGQIVRTTRRAIEKTLGIGREQLFDEDMQDRMICYLFGLRGIDKWLAGRLSQDTLINNLAQEWASLPTVSGAGFYKGQRTPITTQRLRDVLAEVRQRHLQGQPIPPVVNEAVADAAAGVKSETNWWGWGTTGVGGIGVIGTWLADKELASIAAFGAVALVGLLIVIFLGPRLARSIKQIREELS